MASSGAIPFTAIDRWARRYGVAGDDFDRLHALLRKMDDAFLSWKAPTTGQT